MSDRLNAIVYPDFQGRQAMSGDFARRIHGVMPDAVVVSAVNGVHLIPHCDEGVHPVMCGTGFNRAVVDGLRYAVALGATRVARIDTEEHPVELLPAAFAALDDFDVVVLDLAFDCDTLRAGSADEYHNLHVMPEILDSVTGHSVSLTGAHGFMAFRGEALARMLPFVDAALSYAETQAAEANRPPVRWAADTAFPVCAVRLGLRVCVLSHPSVVLRDRDGEKCAIQTRDTLAIVQALERLFPRQSAL
jgi:hypothetical protein